MVARRVSIVLIITLLGLLLRFHRYTQYPQRGATSDEYAFAFLGVSLLTKHVPIAWSAIPLYADRQSLTIDGLYFPMVQPYMDHPPLFGLLVGGWSFLFGQKTFEEVQLSTIRMVPVLLGTLSTVLVFLIGKRLFCFKTGLWASLVYATAPIVVINSRIVVAESLITPLLLGTVYVSLGFFKNKNWQFLLLGLLCGLALLSKALGAVCFLVAAYFLLDKRIGFWRQRVFYLVCGLFVIILWLYGIGFAGDLFWTIQTYQGSRVLGPQTIWTLLTTPVIVNSVFFDGWYFWGIISLGILSLFQDKNMKYIVVPSLIYVLLLVASVNQTDLHGWYMLPLYPFFALAAGYVLVYGSQKISWMFVWFSLVVVLTQWSLLYERAFGLTSGIFRIGVLCLIGPLLVVILRRNVRHYQLITQWVFLLSIIGGIIITLQYIHPA